MTEEQLRKRVDKYMCNAVPGVNTLTGNLDGIMSLFTKQLELAKIEAKIEEANLFGKCGGFTATTAISAKSQFNRHLENRFFELTNQKDLLTKENK